MNPLGRTLFRPTLAVATLLTAACSGTPAPTAAPAPASVSWLCASAPLDIALQKAGVPAGSRPIDLALSANKVSVLLSPARIVTFARNDPQAVDMIIGGDRSPWRAIDRDPTDGSLWVASDESVSLLRIAETGERTIVPGPPVQGQGGFRQIRVTRDAIYATPTAAQSAVWRLSRTGKLLGQSFEQAEPAAAPDTQDLRHRGFWLARDLDGNVVGLDLATGELQRAQDDGTWVALPDRFPVHARSSGRSLHGEAVGTSAESWYFTDEIQGFFFTPSGPVLLGSGVVGVRSRGSALFRIRDGRLETATEACTRTPLVVVVSDSLGFAAVASEMLQTSAAGDRRVLSSQVLLGKYSSRD